MQPRNRSGKSRGGRSRSTTLCRHFLKGTCTFGSECRFSHGSNPAAAAAAVAVAGGEPAVEVASSTGGGAGGGAAGTRRPLRQQHNHGNSKGRRNKDRRRKPASSSSTSSSSSSTSILCPHFFGSGTCRHGAACRHSHESPDDDFVLDIDGAEDAIDTILCGGPALGREGRRTRGRRRAAKAQQRAAKGLEGKVDPQADDGKGGKIGAPMSTAAATAAGTATTIRGLDDLIGRLPLHVWIDLFSQLDLVDLLTALVSKVRVVPAA